MLLIFKNGYTSATGTQEISLHARRTAKRAARRGSSAAGTEPTIENTLQGLGVQWLRTVHTYRVSADARRR